MEGGGGSVPHQSPRLVSRLSLDYGYCVSQSLSLNSEDKRSLPSSLGTLKTGIITAKENT